MRCSFIKAAARTAMALLLVATLISAAEAGTRKFYLTTTSVQGDQVLTACAKGYHFASIFEILEPSNLTYDAKLGFVTADTGSGPPANYSGWVRTGNISDVSSIPGLANCHVWTSNNSNDNGTNAALSGYWSQAATNISPWATENVQCASHFPVWCVSGK
jgi:hypothetical protein